jgi:hypothetical protein
MNARSRSSGVMQSISILNRNHLLQVDMPHFAAVIARTCGDMHELDSVARTCTAAMSAAAADFGCCWETVMGAYEALAPRQARAWRLWQGALSGKAGVEFAAEGCGEAVGEGPYKALRKEVSVLRPPFKLPRVILVCSLVLARAQAAKCGGVGSEGTLFQSSQIGRCRTKSRRLFGYRIYVRE